MGEFNGWDLGLSVLGRNVLCTIVRLYECPTEIACGMQPCCVVKRTLEQLDGSAGVDSTSVPMEEVGGLFDYMTTLNP